jgi:leucyl aminopeptidase
VVFAEKGSTRWDPSAGSFPRRLLLQAKEDGFKGKKHRIFFLRPEGQSPAERLLLLSAGEQIKAEPADLRVLAALAVRHARDAGWKSLSLLVPEKIASPADALRAMVEGALLGAYRFDRYKSSREPSALNEIEFVASRSNEKDLAGTLAGAEAFATAVCAARDMINTPASDKTPMVLAAQLKKGARGPVTVTVHGKTALHRMKMGALLGVNRGSAHPPALVHLHYRPDGKPSRRIALVGKGITFDSGGLSLKPADGMMTMKYDMAGAASIASVVTALAALRPPVEVHGVAVFTENMPGPDAYKPGDVLRAANGKTIEALNTDAEGRLVLADALTYAARLDVDEIVDVATLTGAVTVALGKAYVALMTNTPALEEKLKAAAERAGEKMWSLPLEPSYKDHIKSKVADLKNIGNPGEAGAIIGGLFLEEFAGSKPWAHLDIAGAGWNGNGTPLSPPGATGVMVRTLLHYILGG